MAPFYSKLPNKAEMPAKRAFVAAGFSPASHERKSKLKPQITGGAR